LGRTIAQVVSRQFPNAAARVRAQVTSCRICGERRDTGAGFLRVYFGFPMSILIPPAAPHSSSIVWGWCTIGELVADVPSGLKSHPTPRKKDEVRQVLRGYQGGDDLLECDVVQSGRWLPTFLRNLLSSSSGQKIGNDLPDYTTSHA
jgi:hypothetical protein